jgi:fructose-1,6-bisphosphatase/inositol monophosphatase family enzyme
VEEWRVSFSELLGPIRALHETIRDAVVAACERSAYDDLARVAADDEGDTIYHVDRVSEELLVAFFEREIAPTLPLVLIAEGLDGGKIVLPRGTREEDARVRIIMDPIDGTRGLMYQKRPAWILTGVAPNRGPETCLRDIELALMTEVPLVKQHLCDTLWAERGGGFQAERFDRIARTRAPLELRPSRAETIAHGYAQLVRFFPGVREDIAAIEDEVVRSVLGPVRSGKAQCFEDQYISTGGQLYELIAGRDRFTADLRPLLGPCFARRGMPLGICCHPYDLCTELIAREAGVIVTDARGEPPSAPLAVEPNVAWIAYANPAIRAQIQAPLRAALAARGL